MSLQQQTHPRQHWLMTNHRNLLKINQSKAELHTTDHPLVAGLFFSGLIILID